MIISSLLKRENNNIDLLRLVLAIMVIWGHTSALNGYTEYWVDPVLYLLNFTYSGALAVKIFFFLSGLVVTNSLINNYKPLRFVIARIFRIMPALVFVLFCTVLLIGPIITEESLYQYFKNDKTLFYFISNLSFRTNFDLPGVFSNNLYKGVVNGSLWTLPYEIRCYMSLLGIFTITKSKRLCTFICLIVIADVFLPFKIYQSWLGDSSEVYLLPAFFALGAIIAIHSDKVTINGYVIFSFLMISYLFKSTQYFEFIITSTICFVFLYIFSIPPLLFLKPKYDISYGVYLWGFLVQQLVYLIFGQMYSGLHFIISVSIAILLGYISAKYIEYPLVSIGRSISAKVSKYDLAY